MFIVNSPSAFNPFIRKLSKLAGHTPTTAMGMPPNHPLPNFRLISVPLVRCKPPKGLPTFPPDMQSSENCNHQSQPHRHYPLQQPETHQLWYVLDKDVEKQLSTKHCHSSFPNLVPWSCVLHPNFAWPKAGSHPQYYNTIPLKSTPQKLHTHGSSKLYKDQPPVFMGQQSVRPSSVDALRNVQNVQTVYPVQLRRDPDLVKHCKRWPPGQTNVLQITNSVSLDQKIPIRSTEAKDSNTRETGGTKNGPNPNNDTLPQLERKLNRLYERKQQLTEQLLEEERSLQRLLLEEMSITGVSPNITSHMGHQCIQNGSQKSSSDLSIPSAEEESQLSRPNCIMGKFRWRTARRSKSAHERPSERSHSFRKSMFRYTELSDESPNSRGFTPLDGLHQPPSEKQAETPVLRKHLKWWRLNRRRSTIEESKRRPSPEAVNVNSPLRSRGNSMPPGDQRSTTVYSNTPRGRSNRSSMKMPGFIVPDWWDKVVLGNGGEFFAGQHHLPNHWIIMRNSNQVMLMNNENQLGCRGHLLFQPTTQCPNHKMTGPSTLSAQVYTNVDRLPPFTETDKLLRSVPNTVTGDFSAPKLSKTDEHHRKHKQIDRLFRQQPEQWTTIRCEPGLQRYSTKFRQSPPPIPPKGAAYQVDSHLATPVYFHPVPKCEQDLRHAQTATTSSDSGIKYRSGESQGADGKNVKQFLIANSGLKAQMNTTDRTTFVPIQLSDRMPCTQTHGNRKNTVQNQMLYEPVVQPRNVGRRLNGYEFITQDHLFRLQKPRSSIPAYVRSKHPSYNLCVSGPWKSLPPSAERLQTDMTQKSVCQPIFCNVLCEPTPYIIQKSQGNSAVGGHRSFHAIAESHSRDGRQFNLIGQKPVLTTREPFQGWDVQVAQNVKETTCSTNRKSSNPARQSWTPSVSNPNRASILKPIATTPKRMLHISASGERGRLNTKALWEPRTNSQSDYTSLVFATDSMQVTQRSDRRTH